MKKFLVAILAACSLMVAIPAAASAYPPGPTQTFNIVLDWGTAGCISRGWSLGCVESIWVGGVYADGDHRHAQVTLFGDGGVICVFDVRARLWEVDTLNWYYCLPGW